MKGGLLAPALALVMILASGARAAGATDPPAWTGWSKSGLEVGLRLSALSVFNAAPLAYSPLSLGWRFKNGLRVRTGIEIFYYEGQDSDPGLPPQPVPSVYSYEMLNWRSSVDYVVPLPFRLRPVTGLSLDLISGVRSRVAPGLLSPPKIAAWSVLAPGALLGMAFRGGPHWSLELHGRYAYGFTETGPVAAAELEWNYLF